MMWAALVDTPRLHQEIVGVWGKDVFGIDMSAIRPTAVNTWCKSRIRPPQLVTSPECWAVLDYAVLQSPHVRGDAAWEIRDDRTAHGIGVWFDWEGAQAVAFSNSPLSSERHIFGQAFFPWPEPVDLCRGDEVRVRLRSDAVGPEYVYGWETLVRGKHGGTKAAFDQSDFLGAVMSSDRLQQLSKTFTPTLNEEGRIDQTILNGAAGQLSIEQIAREVAAQFPHRFATWTDAQTRVRQVSSKYSE